MRIKKRAKSSRFRGSHTHSRGFKKKARGSGHRGGFGMAGTGKRGDQKKTLILNLPEAYFGTKKRWNKPLPVKLPVINLAQISENIISLVNAGKAKSTNGVYSINLAGFKVLGNGELTIKAKINAKTASASAIKKINSSGSEIVVSDDSIN